jgi:transposase
MIQIAPQIRILVAVESIDGRKGLDAIAQLCREKLNADPFSGYLFIFRTRRGTAIRVLQYDGQGFWLATKRLSKGCFQWWPTGTEPVRTLRAHQAQLLLAAGNPDCGSSTGMAARESLKTELPKYPQNTCVPFSALAH